MLLARRLECVIRAKIACCIRAPMGFVEWGPHHPVPEEQNPTLKPHQRQQVSEGQARALSGAHYQCYRRNDFGHMGKANLAKPCEKYLLTSVSTFEGRFWKPLTSCIFEG